MLTRRRIVEASQAVFERQGFEGARIEDIAAEAGVAVPTVYKGFANKRNLLKAAVEVAMTGGAEAPIDRQAWFREQLNEPDAKRQLRLIARNARRMYERAGELLEVVRAAAAGDPQIDAVWQSINDERRSRSRASARRLAQKAPLAASQSTTELTLWTLTVPELYVFQVPRGGRTPDQYERWLGDLLVAAILAP